MAEKKIKSVLLVIWLLCTIAVKAQSFQTGDIVLNGNIGAPHLFKNIVKLAAKTDAFQNNFDGGLEISNIKGLTPIAIKGEYGLQKNFSLGFSVSFWNIYFEVIDYYNLQRLTIGNIFKDSVDIYKFNISSKSVGIRPNWHIPLKSRKHDFYIGCGLGMTKNKLTIDFSSTDIGRFAKKFGKNIERELSLPGFIYFAPSLGYRFYFIENFGLNFELGYEKGAIVQGGILLRFNS